MHHITPNWRDFTLVQDSLGAADPDVGATLHVTSSVKDSTDALVSARVERKRAYALMPLIPLHTPSSYPLAWITST